MIGLLVFKEKLKQFYGKYNIYIVPVVRFLVGFLTFWLINANVGFMTKLKNPLIPVVMGLIASFIPYGVTAFLAGIFILIHVSQVSLEIALIYQFFVFAVDYTRTEYLQYEDDDYYYYVKAVPKLTVSAPDVKVQRIYSRKNVRREKNETRE